MTVTVTYIVQYPLLLRSTHTNDPRPLPTTQDPRHLATLGNALTTMGKR